MISKADRVPYILVYPDLVSNEQITKYLPGSKEGESPLKISLNDNLKIKIISQKFKMKNKSPSSKGILQFKENVIREYFY